VTKEQGDALSEMLRDQKEIVLPNDGKALLHPGHVNDLGHAFLHAAEHPASIGQIYNIGGEHALMIKDYVALIADIMQVKPLIEYAPLADVLKRYPGIINERGIKFACQHMCGSIAKAKRDLDWSPEIPLAVGLRDNINWMRQKKII